MNPSWLLPVMLAVCALLIGIIEWAERKQR